MIRTSRSRPFSSLVLVVLLGMMAPAVAGCELEVGPDYPGDAYLGYPPDAYIATTEPWYYEGQACYWYGGFWYYRNGRGWGHYSQEPGALRARRQQGGQARHTYEHSSGRSPGRGGGGGGGRSGGGHR